MACLGVLNFSIVSLLITWCMAADPTKIRVGVILIRGSNSPYDYDRVAPAVDLAVQKVNSEILNGTSYRLDTTMMTYGPLCDGNVAPGGFISSLLYVVSNFKADYFL